MPSADRAAAYHFEQLLLNGGKPNHIPCEGRICDILIASRFPSSFLPLCLFIKLGIRFRVPKVLDTRLLNGEPGILGNAPSPYFTYSEPTSRAFRIECVRMAMRLICMPTNLFIRQSKWLLWAVRNKLFDYKPNRKLYKTKTGEWEGVRTPTILFEEKWTGISLLRWGRVGIILYLRRCSECVGESRSNARINTIDMCQIKTIYNTFLWMWHWIFSNLFVIFHFFFALKHLLRVGGDSLRVT